MEIRRNLGYQPLVYFWLAEFTDGSALAQFDPETGKENKANPDWLPSTPNQPTIAKEVVWREKRLKRFSWCPFTVELAEKVLGATGQMVVVSNNPVYTLDAERLVAYRENMLRYGVCHGGVVGRDTVYVLGKVGGKVLRIHENGSTE